MMIKYIFGFLLPLYKSIVNILNKVKIYVNKGEMSIMLTLSVSNFSTQLICIVNQRVELLLPVFAAVAKAFVCYYLNLTTLVSAESCRTKKTKNFLTLMHQPLK